MQPRSEHQKSALEFEVLYARELIKNLRNDIAAILCCHGCEMFELEEGVAVEFEARQTAKGQRAEQISLVP